MKKEYTPELKDETVRFVSEAIGAGESSKHALPVQRAVKTLFVLG